MRLKKFDLRAVCTKKKNVVKPLAALTFFSLAAFNVYVSFKTEDKSPEAKREKVSIPSAVTDYGYVNESGYGHEFESSSEFDRIRDGLGITNTRGIKKDIVLKSKSLLIVNVNAGGFIISNSKRNIRDSSPENGWVIAKIRVDGNDWVMNTSVASSPLLQKNDSSKHNTFTALPFPLYSSVSFQKVLERGEHKIEAIGLFYGNFERPDIKLNYSVISIEPIHLISFDTVNDKENFLYLKENENKRNESAKNPALPEDKFKSKASLIMNGPGKRFKAVDPLIYREKRRDVFDLAFKCSTYPMASCHRSGYLS